MCVPVGVECVCICMCVWVCAGVECVCVFGYPAFSLVAQVVLLGHVIVLFYSLRNHYTVLQYVPINKAQRFQFLYILAGTCLLL